jgi:hypothetical protein
VRPEKLHGDRSVSVYDLNDLERCLRVATCRRHRPRPVPTSTGCSATVDHATERPVVIKFGRQVSLPGDGQIIEFRRRRIFKTADTMLAQTVMPRVSLGCFGSGDSQFHECQKAWNAAKQPFGRHFVRRRLPLARLPRHCRSEKSAVAATNPLRSTSTYHFYWMAAFGGFFYYPNDHTHSSKALKISRSGQKPATTGLHFRGSAGACPNACAGGS